jgi:hypothetical protein
MCLPIRVETIEVVRFDLQYTSSDYSSQSAHGTYTTMLKNLLLGEVPNKNKIINGTTMNLF